MKPCEGVRGFQCHRDRIPGERFCSSCRRKYLNMMRKQEPPKPRKPLVDRFEEARQLPEETAAAMEWWEDERG